MDEPFGALVAQSSARDGAAIAGAVALLAGCAWAAFGAGAAGDERRRRAVDVAFAATCALFVGALAARAVVVPFVLAAAATLAIARAGRRTALLAAAASIAAAAIGAVAGAAAARGARLAASTEIAPGAEQAEVARWEREKNLFRARWAAITWAKREGADPGDGYLALARLDHALGDDERARKALAKIDAHATSPRVRDEAAKLRAAWGGGP